MKAYKVKLPNYPTFTYLTDTPLAEIPDAIKDKFGQLPESVEPLNKIEKPRF